MVGVQRLVQVAMTVAEERANGAEGTEGGSVRFVESCSGENTGGLGRRRSRWQRYKGRWM